MSVPMRYRYENVSAPFIPTAAIFNERADRDSETMQKAVTKPTNILAAIMGNPLANGGANNNEPKRLSFNEAFYNKFEREEEKKDRG